MKRGNNEARKMHWFHRACKPGSLRFTERILNGMAADTIPVSNVLWRTGDHRMGFYESLTNPFLQITDNGNALNNPFCRGFYLIRIDFYFQGFSCLIVIDLHIRS